MDISTIRSKQQEYHNSCYRNNELYEIGSWLQKPVKTVIELMDSYADKHNLRILDLGCGVGRNSIFMADRVKSINGSVVCVDLLDTAIEQLHKNCKRYGEFID